MAVRATHVTFLDLGLDHSQRPPANEVREVSYLGFALPVVEVENNGVRFAAVDTRVMQQII